MRGATARKIGVWLATISRQASPVDAGGPYTTDGGIAKQLSGSASGVDSVLWTTAGDGTFDDDTALDATYTPGPADVAGVSVTLTLTGYVGATPVASSNTTLTTRVLVAGLSLDFSGIMGA